MCWNEHVSLNSFLFSAGMLGLLVYNNTFTPYKIAGWNVFYYFFAASFISMQLVEYFLWRNMGNAAQNKFWTNAGQGLLVIQPIVSLLMLGDPALRIGLLLTYGVFIAHLVAKYDVTNLSTRVAPNGHLHWQWAKVSWLERLTWLFFLMFSLVYNKYYKTSAVGLLLFAVTYYSYHQHQTAGSMWCWMVNLSMLAYAVALLVVFPFMEHGITTC